RADPGQAPGEDLELAADGPQPGSLREGEGPPSGSQDACPAGLAQGRDEHRGPEPGHAARRLPGLNNRRTAAATDQRGGCRSSFVGPVINAGPPVLMVPPATSNRRRVSFFP